MSETVVLRFRDLVTEPGGTIREHVRILREHGTVWWGWWMRQSEEPPRELFGQLLEQLNSGTEPAAWLFDTGQELLHTCRIADLRISQSGENMGPPALEKAPAYYQRGTYPAWFLLSDISAEPLDSVPESWSYAAFPSNPERAEHAELRGQAVASLAQLRNTDATIWLVSEEIEQ